MDKNINLSKSLVKKYDALIYFKGSAESHIIELFIDKESLTFKYNDLDYFIPISQAKFNLGGEDNQFIVILYNDLNIFIKEIELIDELISSRYINNKDNFLKLKESIKKSKLNKKLSVVYVIGFFFAIIAVCILSFNPLINLSVDFFPLKWEKTLGDAVLVSVIGGQETDKGEMQKAVTTIGDYLNLNSKNNKYDFKFYVIKKNEINAMALPGGNVIVYTGLLKSANSPEEVAGVLAHELQHVYQRHSLKAIIKQLGISIIFQVMIGDVGNLASQVTNLKFSRDMEYEADKLGTKLLYDSKINPSGLINFFDKLNELDKNVPEAFEIISTHPDTNNRMTELKKMISEYPPIKNPKTFNIDWRRIKLLASQ